MPKTFDIEGVGPVEFPDDATDDEVLEVSNHLLPEHPLTASLRPVMSLPPSETMIVPPERFQQEVARQGVEMQRGQYPFPGDVIPEAQSDVAPFVPVPEAPRFTQSFSELPVGAYPSYAASSLWNAVVKPGVEFVESPRGIATLGTGSMGPLAARVVAGGFAADLLRNLPQQARESGRLSVEGTSQQSLESNLGLGANVLFAGGTTYGTFKPGIYSELRLPESLKALEEQPAVKVPPSIQPLEGFMSARVQPGERAGLAIPTTGELMSRPGLATQPKPPPVVVPETVAEARETVIESIRKANAQTLSQIQALFPEARLSREQARVFRNLAFPPVVEPVRPQATVEDILGSDIRRIGPLPEKEVIEARFRLQNEFKAKHNQNDLNRINAGDPNIGAELRAREQEANRKAVVFLQRFDTDQLLQLMADENKIAIERGSDPDLRPRGFLDMAALEWMRRKGKIKAPLVSERKGLPPPEEPPAGGVAVPKSPTPPIGGPENALPLESSTTIPFRQAPEDSGAVGEGIRGAEESAGTQAPPGNASSPPPAPKPEIPLDPVGNAPEFYSLPRLRALERNEDPRVAAAKKFYGAKTIPDLARLAKARFEEMAKPKPLTSAEQISGSSQPVGSLTPAQTEIAQSLIDRPATTSEGGANIISREAINIEPQQIHGVNVNPAMVRGVLAATSDSQVLNAVVKAIPVDMMHDLFGREFSSKPLLDQKAMLVDALSVDPSKPVPRLIVGVIDKIAPFLKIDLAAPGTELPVATQKIEEGSATELAGEGGHANKGIEKLPSVSTVKSSEPPQAPRPGPGAASPSETPAAATAPVRSPQELQRLINRARAAVKISDPTKSRGKEARARLAALEQELQAAITAPSSGPVYWSRESPQTDISKVRPTSGADTGERVRLANGQVWEYKGISAYRADNANRVNGWERVTPPSMPETPAVPPKAAAGLPEPPEPPAPPTRYGMLAPGAEMILGDLPGLGVVSPSTEPFAGKSKLFSESVKDAASWVRDVWRGFAMKQAPRITDSNRAAGEAGVEYASSHLVARSLGLEFAGEVRGQSKIDKSKLGTALTEDNLRGIRDQWTAEATKLAAAGDATGVATAQGKANAVRSLIGAERSPFKTEKEYQDFLADPVTQEVIARHKQLWAERKDPIFRKANDLNPDVPLASRGQQTGARINLKALSPGDTAVKPVGGQPTKLRQFATKMRKDPFARRAKGSGEAYETDYDELMAHGFGVEYPIASQHEFIKAMIDAGDAVVTAREFDPDLRIKGEKTVANLLNIKPWRTQWLQVRRSLADEYRAISNLDEKWQIRILTPFNEIMTKQSIRGLAEFSTHASNLMMEIFTGLGPTANPLINALTKSLGRIDLLYSIPRVVIKAFTGTKSDMLRLAEKGMAKEPYAGQYIGGLLNSVDKGVRLTSAQIYDGMAKEGWVEDTATGKREFINQVGNYNKRLQPWLIRRLRDTGIQPFATAMQTFNVMGLRRVVMAPGAKATSNMAALALRADIAAGFLGFAVLVTMLNKLVSGSATGPAGTPLGAVGWTDENGRVRTFNVARLLGYERGPRFLGATAYIEARRNGLTHEQGLEAMTRQWKMNMLSYPAGPGPRFIYTATTGKRMTDPETRQAPVVPPTESLNPFKSQMAKNIQTAIVEANPILSSLYDRREGKSLGDIAEHQLSRYTPRTTRTEQFTAALPRIVTRKDVIEYADDVAKEARKLPRGDRLDYIYKRFDKDSLEGQYMKGVMDEIKRKGVLRYE